MATARQIEANRRNAAGPHQMSEPGKQAIRGNAIRHGLAASSAGSTTFASPARISAA